MKKLILVASLFLASCATVPVAPVVSPTHRADVASWFAANPTWGMNGRVAVSSASGGGSGSLEWVALRDGYTATITAPITRQTWKLTSRAGVGATLEGLPGGTRNGPSAQQLLYDATRWNVPLAELQQWMKGLAPATATLDPRTGLPQRFVDGPWTVTYEEWSPAADGVPVLPRRISAVSGADTRVRLIIDTWVPDASE